MQESIKNKLHSRFLSEEKVPGVSVTKKVQDEEDDVNKKAQKDIKAKLDAYDKASGKKDKDAIVPPKRELSDEEEEIRQTVEKQGGMERLKFDGEVPKMYSDRQKMAIEGDSKMGNETKTGKWNPETGEGNGNTEPVWGASNADFGKNLVKQTKKAKELEDKSTDPMRFFGDDMETVKGSKARVTQKKLGVGESTVPTNKEQIKEGLSEKGVQVLTKWVNELGANEAAVKLINKVSQTGMVSDFPDTMEYGNGVRKVESYLSSGKYDMAYKSAKSLANKLEKNAMKGMFENKESIKENKMKRLKFKKPFNGLEKALNLIPEHYRVDDKEFEMTDGNETYRIRWEGSLKEGKAVVLKGENKTFVNEDMEKIKHLFSYNSSDTLGIVRGKARVDENKVFGDIWAKTKALLNEEDDEEEKGEKIDKTGAYDPKKHGKLVSPFSGDKYGPDNIDPKQQRAGDDTSRKGDEDEDEDSEKKAEKKGKKSSEE